MSRHFEGTDYVDLGPGSSADVDGGPSTIVILWRPGSVHEGWLLDAENGAGGHAFAINPYTDGYIWHTMVGFRQTMGYTATDEWRLDLWTKAAGTSQVRGHSLLLSGGGWSHADYGTSADSTNIPTTHYRVGRHFSASGQLDGDVAAIAVIQSEWDDSSIESGSLTVGLAQWMTMIGADPSVVWAFNQSDVSDPVTDVTGGGGDQLAISGTSVTDDPAGFSYLLSTPTDCQLSGTIPMTSFDLVGSALSTGQFAMALPAITSRLTIGASVFPPSMTGSATVRGLVGTATVV